LSTLLAQVDGVSAPANGLSTPVIFLSTQADAVSTLADTGISTALKLKIAGLGQRVNDNDSQINYEGYLYGPIF